MRIDRCVCFDRTFDELLAEAASHDVCDVPDLQRIRPFGMQCGLCVPYVREALRTGRTVFSTIIRADPPADAA